MAVGQDLHPLAWLPSSFCEGVTRPLIDTLESSSTVRVGEYTYLCPFSYLWHFMCPVAFYHFVPLAAFIFHLNTKDEPPCNKTELLRLKPLENIFALRCCLKFSVWRQISESRVYALQVFITVTIKDAAFSECKSIAKLKLWWTYFGRVFLEDRKEKSSRQESLKLGI